MLNVYSRPEKSVIIFGSEVFRMMNIQKRDKMCMQTSEEDTKNTRIHLPQATKKHIYNSIQRIDVFFYGLFSQLLLRFVIITKHVQVSKNSFNCIQSSNAWIMDKCFKLACYWFLCVWFQMTSV